MRGISAEKGECLRHRGVLSRRRRGGCLYRFAGAGDYGDAEGAVAVSRHRTLFRSADLFDGILCGRDRRRLLGRMEGKRLNGLAVAGFIVGVLFGLPALLFWVLMIFGLI